MAVPDLNFDTDVLPVVRKYAAIAFYGDSDRPTKMADMVSEAWLVFQTAGPKATPDSIAWYALRRVNSGRHFQQSGRSITGPNPRRVKKGTRKGFDVGSLAAVKDRPAKLATLRIDFEAWFNTLNHHQQTICIGAILGDGTAEMADKFGVTPSAISYMRRWLVENWLAYTA